MPTFSKINDNRKRKEIGGMIPSKHAAEDVE